MRLSMVQNNGELVAGDAGIKFEMIFASQEICSILRTVLRTIIHLQSILCTIRNVWEWAAWILWIGLLSENYQPWSDPISCVINLMTYDPEQNQAHYTIWYSNIEILWIHPCHHVTNPSRRFQKIPRAPKKNRPHWIPFEYFLREGILKLWTSCWPTTLDQWLPQAWLTFFF